MPAGWGDGTRAYRRRDESSDVSADLYRGPMSETSPAVLAARILLRELVLRGVRDVVLCPGSRSAPLAYAAAAMADAGVVRLHVRIDERAAGFLAIGLCNGYQALGDRSPVAIITTSGTAVANLHPAMAEARHAGVPIIALTADRPAELRGTGANQTTDQVGIFGSDPVFFADVPAPNSGDAAAEPDGSGPRYWRDLGFRAVRSAMGHGGSRPGPVHLNLCYREPLVPSEPTRDAWWLADQQADEWQDSAIAFETGPASIATVARGPRTVVVAGDVGGVTDRTLAEISELALVEGWPVLAEPSSILVGHPNSVPCYRYVLSSSPLAGSVERVVVVGHPTLSRPVTQLVSRGDVELVVLHDGEQWSDPGRRARIVAGRIVVADVIRGTGSRDAEIVVKGDGWLAQWLEAGSAVEAAIESAIDRDGLTGLDVAGAVWESLQDNDILYLGSSSPIRDIDLVAGLRRTDRTPLVVAHRGLAGIDGTVSAAVGAALAASESPSGGVVTALMGDLTFLHDTGGLLIGPMEQTPDLRIVVVNDRGGSIFATLEPGDGREPAAFGRVFQTPHQADIAALCEGYGVRHRVVATLAELERSLRETVSGIEVVEVEVAFGERRPQNIAISQAAERALAKLFAGQ